jgi:hypothetical protein
MFATLALAFAASAAAIQVTAPSNTTGWTSTGAQVIEWDVSLECHVAGRVHTSHCLGIRMVL